MEIKEIELPETFICSNCGELSIDMFSEGTIKYATIRGRNTTYCVKCNKKYLRQYYKNNTKQEKERDKNKRIKHNLLSEKYQLPKYWFKYTKSGLEYGMVAQMTVSSNRRSDIRIKPKELWLLYCCHIYLHGRVCAYSKLPFQYFYSADANQCLNNYMPSLDHKLSLSTIGTNDLSNITFSTYNFNLRKGSKTLQEMYEKEQYDLGIKFELDVDGILGDINNTYQYYRKTRGTSKMDEIEQYVLTTSPYKTIEEEIKGENIDFGY